MQYFKYNEIARNSSIKINVAERSFKSQKKKCFLFKILVKFA